MTGTNPLAKGRALLARVPRDLAAGLFLVALALVAYAEADHLQAGTLRHFGPGMLPRALAVLTGLCGLAIGALAYADHATKVERLAVRGPLFVLGGAVAFGLTIQTLGLSLAGPLAILIVAGADEETRWGQAVVFAVLLTAFCVLLFRVALSQPIPLAPWLLDY